MISRGMNCMRTKIYFDMDGVFCNFVERVNSINPLLWELDKKETICLFWDSINDYGGREFWSRMQPCRNALDLYYQLVCDREIAFKCGNDVPYDVGIITQLPNYPECHETLFRNCRTGKMDWIKWNLCKWKDLEINFVTKKVGKTKYAKNNILIDDFPKYGKRWEEHGGIWIPFNIEWNKNYYNEIANALKRLN